MNEELQNEIIEKNEHKFPIMCGGCLKTCWRADTSTCYDCDDDFCFDCTTTYDKKYKIRYLYFSQGDCYCHTVCGKCHLKRH